MGEASFDLVGVGLGPFNLSIAALAGPRSELSTRFFDAKPSFAWHPGMMLPDARLQMSPLKDLVTPVEPTNPYGFIDYLVDQGRYYQWLHAELPAVSRREYEDYMAWVADDLDNARFGHRVEAITYDEEAFQVHVEGQGVVHSRGIVLGTGQAPSVPACAEGKLGDTAFHNATLAGRELDLSDRRVAIVGGGQSGAEVLQTVLAGHWGSPARLDWLTRRPNFQPLDEVAFTNEYFTPAYVDAFHDGDPQRRRQLVEQQKLASDGISPSDLRSLYRTIYEAQALDEQAPELRLLPNRELSCFQPGEVHRLGADNRLTGERETLAADVVVFCTGYDYQIPACLDPIAQELASAEEQPYELDSCFRVGWDGPEGLDLFAVNAGRYSHGIAEPQMSLMAWRGARILDAAAGEPLFDPGDGMQLVDWEAPSAAGEPPRAPAAEVGRRRSG